jgi:hypothetical protein
MTITIYPDLEQGSDEWLQLRCGTLTAGSCKLIMTAKTMKAASNEAERAHMWELIAQRISGYIEPSFLGDEMIRGLEDEITARELYAEKFAPVVQVGHVTNDGFGFTMGYSPDGLVGDDGMIEIKSRRQRFTIEQLTTGIVPDEFLPQMQMGMLITGRKWCDFIVFCGGLPMVPIRVHADPQYQAVGLQIATQFEMKMRERIAEYYARIAVLGDRAVPTERRIDPGDEITI